MKGLIAVPVYNEVDNLSRVIAALRARFSPKDLLIIDDGSTDGTHRILVEAGVPYMRHPVNLGYEEALRTGMVHALNEGYEFVVFFDGDGQHRVEDLEKIIRAFDQDPCDLIVGSRYKCQAAHRPSVRSLITKLFSGLTSTLAGTRITDVTCGLKLISRDFIPVALQLPTEDMHAEFIVALSFCGARIREEDIIILPRTEGESMYGLSKAFLYPLKTLLCLAGSLFFLKRLKLSGSGAYSHGPAK